jgi:hypothetical protein
MSVMCLFIKTGVTVGQKQASMANHRFGFMMPDGR